MKKAEVEGMVSRAEQIIQECVGLMNEVLQTSNQNVLVRIEEQLEGVKLRVDLTLEDCEKVLRRIEIEQKRISTKALKNVIDLLGRRYEGIQNCMKTKRTMLARRLA